MEINHRIAINGDHDKVFKSRLDELGIQYRTSPLPGGSIGLVYFDIAESDRNWAEVAELIRVWGASDFYGTRFDREEILAAEWNRLVPTFEQGFPQPEDEPGWKIVTYDNTCPTCGAGFVQKAPFRFSAEPRLGKHDFVSLSALTRCSARPTCLRDSLRVRLGVRSSGRRFCTAGKPSR